MKYLLGIIVVLALALGGYNFFYPPKALERKVAHTLEAIGKTVATKDRTKISEEFRQDLADDVKIHLEVSMFSLSQPTGGNVLTQDFDKQGFITFLDNVLYPLTDYSYEPKLEDFTASADRRSAAIAFSAFAWADGVNLYGGTSIDMRFSSDTNCTGQVGFEQPNPRLHQVSCKMELRAVPKPGQEGKFHNMDTLKDFLK